MTEDIEINLFSRKPPSATEPNKNGPAVETSSWLMNISVKGADIYLTKTVHNPFNQNQEEECRWYVEDFASKSPFQERRAVSVVEELKGYANSLLSQLELVELVNDILSSQPCRSITITVAQDDGDEDEGAENSIQQLHWELLEDPSLWPSGVEIIVKRHVKAGGESSIHELSSLDEDRVSGEPRVNALLVVARDLSTDSNTVDIKPNLALQILAKIRQDLVNQGLHARLNLEVVRPGTLEALKEHLQKSSRVHGKGFYHFVHFDVHGTVDKKKKKNNAAYLHFNDPHPDKYGRKPQNAKAVAEILQIHGIRAAVINACESARATSGDAANIAKTFARCGVQNIVAMSFEVHMSAAERFLRCFYHSLFLQGYGFSQAARQAREVLRSDPERQARLGLKRPVNDHFVPVVYSLGQDAKFLPRKRSNIGRRLSAIDFSTQTGEVATKTDPPLVGRDFDLLRLEKHLLQRGIVHLTGRAGVGKTALLRYARDIWLQTAFVDIVLFIDFSKAKASSDVIKSLVSQIPVERAIQIKLASDLQTLIDSQQYNQNLFSSLILKSCPQQNLMIVIDGVQFIQETPFQEVPNTIPKEARPSIIRFMDALLTLDQSSSNVSIKYIISSRLDHSTLPISEKLKQELGMSHFRLRGLELEDAAELSQDSLRRGGLDIDNWKDADEREHKLAVGLLDGNPSAILQTMPLMVQSGIPLNEFTRLIQTGIPPEKSFPGPGKVISDEIDTLFRSLNDDQRVLILLLSAFWNEGVRFNYFIDWAIEQKLCKSYFSSLVFPYIQGRGLIDYEMGSENAGGEEDTDATFSWIHPLITVYGRRVAHEILTRKYPSPGKNLILTATLVCSVLGAKFKANTISKKTASLLHRFNSWFLTGIASVDIQSLSAAMVEDLTYQKLKSFWPLQVGNLALCLALCSRTSVPMDQWPLDYFQFHAGNIRLVAFPAELENFTGRFETLLDTALQINEKGSAMPPKYDIFALTMAICLCAIYTSARLQAEKEEKYVNIALKIVRESEKEYGSFKTGSRALYLKGKVCRHALVLHLRRGSYEDALTAAKISLEIDESFKKETKDTHDLGAGWDAHKLEEMTKKLSGNDQSEEAIKARLGAISSNTMLYAYIDSRKRLVELLQIVVDQIKAGKQPEENLKFGAIVTSLGREMGKINAVGNLMGLKDVNRDSGWLTDNNIRRFLKTQSEPEERLKALENAISLSNAPEVSQQIGQLMLSSFRALDIDGLEGYFNGLVELSQKNILPGMESLGNAPEEVIKAAELRLQTWLNDANAMDELSPDDAEARRVILQKASELVIRELGSPNFRQNLVDGNLEFEQLKHKLQTAEQAANYSECLETLNVLETFCKQPGHEIFKLSCSDSWIQESRLEYQLRVAAQPMKERYAEGLSQGKYTYARQILLDFEAKLPPELRESASAKKIISRLKTMPQEMDMFSKKWRQ
ncbi:hypothetical protein ZTR_03034 [Talaromyces verruculosus]|nr:hypothetical protein ZTR_03034 [Talaromyces verruculosus]